MGPQQRDDVTDHGGDARPKPYKGASGILSTEEHDMKRLLVLVASLALIGTALAQERSIRVASTTSTEQSGLFGYLLPRFTQATGIGVKVVAVGTGQALDIGRRGDADVVFVHDKPAELKFLSEGFGVKRYEVMYNDFVVIGPKADPAHIAGEKDVAEALRKIAETRAT